MFESSVNLTIGFVFIEVLLVEKPTKFCAWLFIVVLISSNTKSNILNIKKTAKYKENIYTVITENSVCLVKVYFKKITVIR